MERVKRITIIGSSCFAKQMVEYRDKLRNLGYQCDLHEHYVAYASGEKKDLWERMQREHANLKKQYDYIRYHYKEIVDSDVVLVLNFDKNGIKNYIGGNTLIELGFAHVCNKKIFLLNPVSENVSYVDEIKAMVDVILNGNLNKIAV